MVVKHLKDLKSGEVGRIARIDGGHGMVSRLSALGIRPGRKIRKLSSALMRGPVTIEVDRTQVDICREGEFGDTMFIVVKGEVAVFKKDDRGRAILLNLIKEGDIVGEGAFLNPGPRGADVVANKDSVIIELPRKKTMEFVLNHPHLQQGLERKAELRLMTGLISINGVLRDIPMHMRQHLASEARIKHYPPKTIIHRAGEELTRVDMLLRGKAAYVMQNSAGKYVLLESLPIGELIGDTSAVFKASCPADLMTLEYVSMAHIPYGAFKNVVEAYPPLRENLFRHAEEQRERFMRKMSKQPRG